MAVGPAGDVYIADTGNNRLRKVASDGTISTVAGNGLFIPPGDLAATHTIVVPPEGDADGFYSIAATVSGATQFGPYSPGVATFFDADQVLLNPMALDATNTAQIVVLLQPGVHSISAVYSGNASSAPSTSAAVQVNVPQSSSAQAPPAESSSPGGAGSTGGGGSSGGGGSVGAEEVIVLALLAWVGRRTRVKALRGLVHTF